MDSVNFFSLSSYQLPSLLRVVLVLLCGFANHASRKLQQDFRTPSSRSDLPVAKTKNKCPGNLHEQIFIVLGIYTAPAVVVDGDDENDSIADTIRKSMQAAAGRV